MKQRSFLLVFGALASLTVLLAFLSVHAAQPVQALPVGTFLPVMLNSNIDSDKSKPGQKLDAKLKQDLSLPDGTTVKSGTELFGHIISVNRSSGSSPARIVFVFDNIKMNGRLYPITTDLRAAASMMAIFQARQPINSVAMDASSSWDYNTRQVGGDVVFGRKDVRSGDGVVAMSPEPGAVVGIPRANEEAGCPAPDNKNLQSFWLFSTSACGVYGNDDAKMEVSRKPSDNNDGHITLIAPKRVELRNGGGLLLVVEPQPAAQTVQ
jgi:hypothetical protein